MRTKAHLPSSLRGSPSVALVVLSLSLFTSQANAAESKVPPSKNGDTSGSTDERKAYFEEARAAFRAGKYVECKALLLKMAAIKETPRALFSLAEVEMKLQEFRAAARHATLSIKSPDLPQDKRKVMEGILAEAKKQVGTVEVTVNVEGAALHVDGEGVGALPLTDTIFLEPGKHKITVSKDGYTTVERDLDVTKGSEVRVDIALVENGSPSISPVTTGNPSATTDSPSATKTPVAPFDEPKSSEQSSGPNTIVLVVGGVVTVGAFASALAFNLNANSEYDKADALKSKLDISACSGDGSQASDCSALRTHTEDGDKARRWANVSAAVGGVALVGTLAYGLWPRGRGDSKAPSTTAAHVNVSVTPVGSWVGLAGRF